ncbi:hypothetical protein D7D52_16355 [Nocardia yunnanensis]|uniref:Uncharacterized protein n=1 Tax=Nocardia yunnanensis TaxID=2382165 RepID=A0A386ZCW3_9NOCA|nr:hypothetical protein [Nocardia yunnanensis]AYF75177.1 hypothetical protein D7D52_16355 [Nocardia yunnanensis]
MKNSRIAGAGLAAAAVTGLLLPAAPAEAKAPVPNACLVIENQTSYGLTVVVRNRLFEGDSWKISPNITTTLTLDNGNAIATADGDWSIDAPSGTWRYEPDWNRDRGCNGSWVYTVS